MRFAAWTLWVGGAAAWAWSRWRSARVSDEPLGKYIILVASLLHLWWAFLLCWSPVAGNSTPLHIISEICGGRYRAAFVLVAAAIPALFYPFISQVGRYELPMMLVPQQMLLFLSAFAGVHAAILGHYADGVARGWAFIAGDQASIIAFSLLYTIAVIEAAWSDRRVIVVVDGEIVV
jgi:hypothetical protein